MRHLQIHKKIETDEKKIRGPLKIRLSSQIGNKIKDQVHLVKEILSNEEKLKEFEMKLIKNQQNLIMGGKLNSDYLIEISRLLQSKHVTGVKGSHYKIRKQLELLKNQGFKSPQLGQTTAKNVNLPDLPVISEDQKKINESYEDIEESYLYSDDQDPENFFEKKFDLHDYMNDDFNFRHENDYLESDFSFEDESKKIEKEQVIYSKLREKYNFFPQDVKENDGNNENEKVFKKIYNSLLNKRKENESKYTQNSQKNVKIKIPQTKTKILQLSQTKNFCRASLPSITQIREKVHNIRSKKKQEKNLNVKASIVLERLKKNDRNSININYN